MKTLNEVIKGLECCTKGECRECPFLHCYSSEDCEYALKSSIFGHLKDYKKMCNYLNERFKVKEILKNEKS